MIRKMSALKKIHFRLLLLFCLLLTSCFFQQPQYDLDSVAHYATRHSSEEGWELESLEQFNIGEYRGAFFEVAYYEQEDLGLSKLRNLLVQHVVNYIQDNQNNQKLIKYVKAKENNLTYRNLSINLMFYEKLGDKSKGPLAFVSYQDENVRYWIHNKINQKYELVHLESIHDSLKLSSLCKDKTLIQERLRSHGEFL